ncbi:hypothetical protein L9G74_14410 [Shewanella sp. C32]|uniref:Lipoprotein n=1 Tax=Shewanella electrica TaxID=515560 RepID=A0ABT2FMR9_9GAMM|nr:hypothetical protein [Shewanella electrica]MCH1926196.1 hypothetical protein [Shewanella electrica]MCS4557639.1 hypothetical protein [Shewanella electrica]
MRIAIIIAAALLMLMVGGCSKPPAWTLFYYSGQTTVPEGEHYHAIKGYYQDLAQCKKKAEGLEFLTETPSVYQCGFQCQLDEHDVVKCDQWHTFTPKQP